MKGMTSFLQDRSAVSGLIGLAVVVTIALLVILAPIIASHGEADLVGEVWAPISTDAWLVPTILAGTCFLGCFTAAASPC